jgi:SAM-dependent methyltransferase
VLERRAHVKFDGPERMLFERTALEQATSPGAARHHAASVPAGASVLDLGCGIGADAIAFARAGHAVLAVDRDAHRAALAAHNLRVSAAGSGRSLAVRGDAGALPGRADVLFVDPDRRSSGGRGRTFRLADTSPSWERIAGLAPSFDTVLVKAPPALPDAEIPPDAAVDFLSEGGECREAFLRLGAGAAPGARRVVRVDAPADDPDAARTIVPGPAAPVADAGAFLLDPDPALRRAGGIDALAHELGAARVASRVSYLFAPRAPASPWVRAYRVLAAAPYRHRDLARLLADDPPRELVVKQRGLQLDEAAIRRGLPHAAAGPRRVVVLWRDGARRRVCLAEPLDPA